MSRRDIVAELDAWAAGKGLGLAGKPEQELEIPAKVTDLDLTKLGDLFWLVGRWVSYVRSELAKEESTLSNLKSEEARAKAKAWKKARSVLRSTARGVEGGREGILSEVLALPELDELMTEIQTANGRVNYLNAKFEDLRRATAMISREFARRNIQMEGDFLTEKKKENAANYGFEE